MLTHVRRHKTNTHVRDVFITVAPPLIHRGWFIAIGYQIPFEGGRRWQQWLTEIRPLADTRPGALPGFPNAVSLEFNCHTFAPKNSFYGIDIKPSSTRARTGDLSRVKRT